MNIRRRQAVLGLAMAPLPTWPQAPAWRLEAPNPVQISPRLLTSGQPTPQALAGLGQRGFQAVLYLAPSTVEDAVPEEPAILARQGIAFVHIPIPFGAPTPAHVQAVSAALSQRAAQQVLVHCQINLRASTMVFLHRVITLREPPAPAWQAVAQVWTPEGAWARLVQQQLKAHHIDFQPL
ncbi:MAG: protein tyrosine phosphatase family protein [Rubrivivax sp.]|nr:protein tyrosine phosphatase family protein [Rubrivivax sp.]